MPPPTCTSLWQHLDFWLSGNERSVQRMSFKRFMRSILHPAQMHGALG